MAHEEKPFLLLLKEAVILEPCKYYTTITDCMRIRFMQKAHKTVMAKYAYSIMQYLDPWNENEIHGMF